MRRRAVPAAVFVIAVAVRAIHVSRILASPLDGTLVQDARLYHDAALRLLGLLPDAVTTGVSFSNLGYPFALAGIGAVFGTGVAPILAVQSVAGALTAVLVSLAARDLSGDDVTSALAGLVCAVYVPAIFYDGLVLTPSLTNLALAAVLAGVARFLQTRRSVPLMMAGAITSIAILLRANVLLLVPFLVVVLGWRRRATVAFVALALAAPGAVIVANGVRHGEWVPVTANGGMNFWLGNAVGAPGVYHPAEFLGRRGADAEERAFLAEARRRSGDPAMTLAASSRFWFQATLDDVARAPGAWILRLGYKAALFASRHEAKTNVSLTFVSWFSPVLRWDPVGFGAVAMLGVAGVTLLAVSGRGRAAALLAAFIAMPFSTCVLFFVSGEYRHPASLALAVGAAVTVRALAGILGGRPLPPRWAWGGAAALVAGVLAFWPRPEFERWQSPALDVRSFVRTLALSAADGSPPSHEDYARARRLLDAAPAMPERDLILKDARMWLSAREAVFLENRSAAVEALRLARDVVEIDPRRPVAGYDAAFLAYLRDATVARVRNLEAASVVRDDPALLREAATIVAIGRSAESYRNAGEAR